MNVSIPAATMRKYTEVRPWRNFLSLAFDWLCIFVLIGGAIGFDLWREAMSLPGFYTFALWGIVVFLIGCLQHRIGLMGHEASHYLLAKNRRANDLLAEFLCFYPLFASLAVYRKKHTPHHLYPNDPEKDPNLGNGKAARLYARFPMSRNSFVFHYYLKLLWPPFVLLNLWDLASSASLGNQKKEERKSLAVSCAGIAYLVGLITSIRLSIHWDGSVLASVACAWLVGVVLWYLLPEKLYSRKSSASLSGKAGALVRLSYYTLFFTILGSINQFTGWNPTVPFLLLWVLPLAYFFPYLMLLREVFQHANAGTEDLDNSRIIYADPFTRWALLGYGNDFHLMHHLYPNVPHYRLEELHLHCLENSESYSHEVEINRGLFVEEKESVLPTVLDALSTER